MSAPRHRGPGTGFRLVTRARRTAAQLLVGAAASTPVRATPQVEAGPVPADPWTDAWALQPPPAVVHRRQPAA